MKGWLFYTYFKLKEVIIWQNVTMTLSEPLSISNAGAAALF
jgi:hypothetical protein